MPGSTATSTDLMTETKVLLAGKFWIEIEGMLEAYFMELSGMQIQTEIFEYKEGGLNTHVHKLPGRTSYSNLTLKHGMTTSSKLWDWYQSTVSGKVDKKNISIMQYDIDPSKATPVKRWEVTGAYPVKWSGPSLNAKGTEHSIETIELAYSFFSLSKV